MIEKMGNVNVCGVYAITSKQGIVRYVGGAGECNDAYSRHKSKLINGEYAETNKHLLQVLFNTEDLLFTILEKCNESELDNVETKYIKLYSKTIVNSDKKGKRRRSKPTPEETERRRKANLGEKNPNCCVLTEETASEILWLKQNTKMKNKEIADIYKCKDNLVSRIGRDRWLSVEPIMPSWYKEESASIGVDTLEKIYM